MNCWLSHRLNKEDDVPEINIRVKIIGGKRTPLEVWVTPMAVNDKKITFQNGASINASLLANIIDMAIIKAIEDRDIKL